MGDRDIRFIDSLGESLRNEGRVDDARVFAASHSNGSRPTCAL
jgi:poly(3-hydroxybutyrate) depolymerase